MLGPKGAAAEHLDTLATVARLMSDDQFRYEAAVARDAHELLLSLRGFQNRVAGQPLAEEPEAEEGLRRTSKFGGGLFG